MPDRIGLAHFIFEKTCEFSQQVSDNEKGFLKIVVAGVAVIVIVAATAIGISVHKSRQQQAEVTKGVEVIRNMEAVDVGAVENRIRQMEEDELKSSEEYKNRPINVKYEDSLILGDSQAEAFIAYKVLDDSEVIAHKGAHIKDVNSSMTRLLILIRRIFF